MTRLRRAAPAIRFALAVAAAAAVGAAPARESIAQTTIRASVDSAGAQSDLDSGPAAISANGRMVAFASTASNLVPNDLNFASDVFVFDRLTGTTVLASADSAGVPGAFDSVAPAISANGRFVVFSSYASNLDPNDTNGASDVFLKDLVTGALRMVSVDSAGVQGDLDSTGPAISSDGRYVAYQSYATNLVPNDMNSAQDIFVFDTVTAATTRASVDSGGAEGDFDSITPSISTNGLLVAFASGASNLVGPLDGNGFFDVFVHDFGTLQTVAASVLFDGFTGNGDSLNPVISPDGGAVSFTSFASNLVPSDSNGSGDVFVRDLFNGTTERSSVGTGGVQSNANSPVGAISADKRFVAFRSLATNLVAGDTNFAQDVFLHERATGITIRVSLDSAGTQADDASSSVAVSGDGRFVAFTSAATNLVPGDTNFASDVFLRDARTCADGTVGSGSGPAVDVLDVNGATRVATVAARTPITVRLAASPAGPLAAANYALWVWRGLPARQETLTISGTAVGCTVNPTPFTPAIGPPAFKCLRGGFGPEYCGSTPTLGASPPSAPWSLTKASGLRSGTVLTLQGVIRDDGAGNPSLLSVTNAVILRIP